MPRRSDGRFSSKPWSELSPKTRAEKQRYGIGPQEHAAGVSVKRLQSFKNKLSDLYGKDREEVRDALRSFDVTKVSNAAALQREMERAYMDGDGRKARELWETRDTSLPEWMFFYHGAFS